MPKLEFARHIQPGVPPALRFQRPFHHPRPVARPNPQFLHQYVGRPESCSCDKLQRRLFRRAPPRVKARRHDCSPQVVLIDPQARHDHAPGVAGPGRFQERSRHVLRPGPRGVRRVGLRRRSMPRSRLEEVVVEVTHPSTELAVLGAQKPASQHVRAEGVLLAVVGTVPKPMPVPMGRSRPLAAPGAALLTRQHVPHFGVDLGTLNLRACHPWRGHNVPWHHPAVARHVHT